MTPAHTIPRLLVSLGRDPAAVPARTILILLCAAAACYGAVMGSWEVHLEGRWQLMVFGAVKMPILVLGTMMLCLPGFFVLNTAAGVRDDFPIALRAIVGAQAAFGAALLSLSPVIRFVYACGVNQGDAILANAALFTLATAAAQGVLFRGYRALREKSVVHRRLLWGWLVLYAFVGIQMGWMLRPFIGRLEAEPTFLRDEPFSNAYVVVVRIIGSRLGF